MFFLTKRPGARAKAVIAAACVAALLAGCKSEVYKGLTETQANAMMSVLLKNGIDSEKEYSKTGYSLRVDSDKVVQTLELMRRNNLPREDFQNMGQIFAAKGMISSSTEEQARMTYALSQELSDTFSSIDGRPVSNHRSYFSSGCSTASWYGRKKIFALLGSGLAVLSVMPSRFPEGIAFMSGP